MAERYMTNAKLTIRDKIESNDFKKAVANVLPAHLTPERFVRLSIAALTRTPKLADCDPNTVLSCMMQLSQFGLEPDGRNAYLIPFGNVCTLIISYMGLVALAKRSGHVSNIHADTVCENDQFHFDKGIVIKHEIDFKKDRGKPYAYYAMVRYKDGTEQSVCMTKAEVDRIKSRSRASGSGPWVTDYDEMGKKTAFRRLSKWLELSPEFRDALEADADTLEDLRFENAIPIQRAQIGRKKKLLNDADEPGGDNVETQPNFTEGGLPLPVEKPAKKKKKLEGLTESEMSVQMGPNETAVWGRLQEMKLSNDDFVAVAVSLGALDEGQGWDDIGEERFGVILREANWPLVEAELKGLAK